MSRWVGRRRGDLPVLVRLPSPMMFDRRLPPDDVLRLVGCCRRRLQPGLGRRVDDGRLCSLGVRLEGSPGKQSCRRYGQREPFNVDHAPIHSKDIILARSGFDKGESVLLRKMAYRKRVALRLIRIL